MKRFHGVLLALFALGACGDGDWAAYDEQQSRGGTRSATSEAILMVPQSGSATGAGDASQSLPDPLPTAAPDSMRRRMLIRTGDARVEVESLEPAVEALKGLATRLGGFVTNISMQTGEEFVRQATLTMRIPVARFDDALAAIEPMGDVESVHVGAEDVGEAYADMEIRLANARRLEQRLLELLTARTGSLEDVLAVERELARVREQIERFEGRMRFLSDRVDLSTLTVTVHEAEPLFSSRPGGNVLLHSVRQAGRNFVALIAGFIASLGVLLPILLVLGLAWWGFRRRRARRGRD